MASATAGFLLLAGGGCRPHAGRPDLRGRFDLLAAESPCRWETAPIEGGGGFRIEDAPEPVLRLESGLDLSGVRAILGENENWPTRDYEIAFEARRVEGDDFFCGLTFPVAESHLTLIAGGWGGGVVGLSSLDDLDASENHSRTEMRFETGRWYAVRLVLRAGEVRVWIDGAPVIRVALAGRRIGLKPGPIAACLPIGFATWKTTAEIRRFTLEAPAGP